MLTRRRLLQSALVTVPTLILARPTPVRAARACTTSQYFTLGTSSALSITGNLTVLCWLLGTGNVGGVFTAYQAAGGNPGYGLSIGNGATAGRLSYWNNVIGSWQEASSTTVNNGVWRSVGITTSGTGAAAGTFWVDGASVGTWTHSAPGTSADTKLIGVNPSLTEILGYRLAEMAVWDAALNSSEISAYHNGHLPLRIRPSSLVAYWPLWGLHDPEPDFGPNRYHATLVASPTAANHPRVLPFTKS